VEGGTVEAGRLMVSRCFCSELVYCCAWLLRLALLARGALATAGCEPPQVPNGQVVVAAIHESPDASQRSNRSQRPGRVYLDGLRMGFLESGRTLCINVSGADRRSHSVRIIGNGEEGEAAFQARPGERINLQVALSGATRVVDPGKLVAGVSDTEGYLLAEHEPPLKLKLLDSGAGERAVDFVSGQYRLSLQDSFGVTWDLTRFAEPTSAAEALDLHLWEAFQKLPRLKDGGLRNPYRLTMHLEPGSALVFEESVRLKLREEHSEK
jgi:hypothetical protein